MTQKMFSTHMRLSISTSVDQVSVKKFNARLFSEEVMVILKGCIIVSRILNCHMETLFDQMHLETTNPQVSSTHSHQFKNFTYLINKN